MVSPALSDNAGKARSVFCGEFFLEVLVRVCLLLQYLLQSCSREGRGIVEDMCYERRRAEASVY
jgi:hypothetical protein